MGFENLPPHSFGSLKARFLCVCGFFTLVFGLQAQVFDISGSFGYRFGGSVQDSTGQSRDIEAGPCYGLALDYAPYASDLMLELFWSRQDSGLNLDGMGLNHVKMTVDEFQLGGIYEYGRGRLRESFTALLGATVFSPDYGDTQVRFSIGVGVGVKYYLTRNFALRADLRGYCTVVESDTAFISNGYVTLLYFSGSAIWQGEVSGGLTLSF